MNLMTKSGQTSSYKATDHLRDLEKYLGRKPDYVLINKAPIAPEILKSYEKYNEIVVENDLAQSEPTVRIVEDDLIDNTKQEQAASDILYRSILRHDSQKVAKAIEKIIYA